MAPPSARSAAQKAKDALEAASPVEAEAPTSGSGTFFYPDGAKYDGEWKFLLPDPPPPMDPAEAKAAAKAKKGNKDEPPPPPVEPPKRVRQGKGLYTHGEYSYKGDFVMDEVQGHGVFKYASGASYDGEWSHGVYHGIGSYRWADGRCYTGDWQEGKMHGHAVYTDTSGHKWEGHFLNGSGPGLTCTL